MVKIDQSFLYLLQIMKIYKVSIDEALVCVDENEYPNKDFLADSIADYLGISSSEVHVELDEDIIE